MYPLSLGDLVLYTVEYSVFSQVCLNTLYYRVSDLPSPITDGADALLALLAYHEDAGGIIPRSQVACATNVTITRHSAQKVRPTRWVRTSLALALDGTNALGVATASNVAGVITKTPIVAGRGRQGAWHQPAVPAAAYSAGLLDDAYQNALSDLGGSIRTPVTLAAPAITFTPVVTSAANGWMPADIVATTTQRTVRVMRRRTVGVGI